MPTQKSNVNYVVEVLGRSIPGREQLKPFGFLDQAPFLSFLLLFCMAYDAPER